MSLLATCPSCGWQPAVFARLPKESFSCPDCKVILKIRAFDNLIRVLIILVFVPLFILAQIDHSRSFIYLAIGLIVFSLLFAISILTRRLDLDDRSVF